MSGATSIHHNHPCPSFVHLPTCSSHPIIQQSLTPIHESSITHPSIRHSKYRSRRVISPIYRRLSVVAVHRVAHRPGLAAQAQAHCQAVVSVSDRGGACWGGSSACASAFAHVVCVYVCIRTYVHGEWRRWWWWWWHCAIVVLVNIYVHRVACRGTGASMV